MTQYAPEWFRPQYESRAMHIYQTKGNRLRTTVTQATSFNDSNEAVFYLAGKTVARKIDRDTDPVNGGGERKKFTAPLSTWQAFDEITDFDIDRSNPKEREVVYESGAMALGRATDKEIYDIMKVAAPSVDAGLDFSAGAFTAGQAMTLVEAIVSDVKIFDGGIFCGLPQRAWFQFLANKVVNSSDHIGPGDLPFNKATDSRYWNGVTWFLNIEEDANDFYPSPGANQVDAFIWHRTAMGWGNKTDLEMIPQWDNRMRGGGGWTFNMKAKGAATTLQEGKGVKRFRLSTNSAIAIV